MNIFKVQHLAFGSFLGLCRKVKRDPISVATMFFSPSDFQNIVARNTK